MSDKLKILDEINEKIIDIQNKLKIDLLFDNGTNCSFDILNQEDVWVSDENFGEGSKYKTLKQYNKIKKNLSPVLFEGKKGNIVDTHTHKESQLFICIEGEILVTVNDVSYIINSYESVCVDSFQPHKFEFKKDSKLIILVLDM